MDNPIDDNCENQYNVGFIISSLIDLIFRSTIIFNLEKKLIDYIENFNIYNKSIKEFLLDEEHSDNHMLNIEKYTEYLYIKEYKQIVIKELMEYELLKKRNNELPFETNLSDIV